MSRSFQTTSLLCARPGLIFLRLQYTDHGVPTEPSSSLTPHSASFAGTHDGYSAVPLGSTKANEAYRRSTASAAVSGYGGSTAAGSSNTGVVGRVEEPITYHQDSGALTDVPPSYMGDRT